MLLLKVSTALRESSAVDHPLTHHPSFFLCDIFPDSLFHVGTPSIWPETLPPVPCRCSQLVSGTEPVSCSLAAPMQVFNHQLIVAVASSPPITRSKVNLQNYRLSLTPCPHGLLIGGPTMFLCWWNICACVHDPVFPWPVPLFQLAGPF